MPKVGYIAVIGRPNAGKSTLINALIGERVSAISSRPQTTQRAIKAIHTDVKRGIQCIFVDTPGIHEIIKDIPTKKIHSINEKINREAFVGLRNADVILRLIDPTRPYGKEDERIDEVLDYLETPIIRIETKQDLAKHYPAKNIDLKINSLTGEGFDELMSAVSEKLPSGPYLYSPDYYTDQPMDFRIQEVIREALFRNLGEEIPYASFVDVAEIKNSEKLLKIQAYIYTETDSQKKILIGK